MSRVGTLLVKPQSGDIHIDTELMGKMDPYCTVKVGIASLNTKVAHDMHKSPVWHDVLTFRLDNDDRCEITVFEKDKITKDDLIGAVVIPLREVYAKKTLYETYEISHEGKVTGRIEVGLEFFPEIPEYHQKFGPSHAQTSSNEKKPDVQNSSTGQQSRNTQEIGHQNNSQNSKAREDQAAVNLNDRNASNNQHITNNQDHVYQNVNQAQPTENYQAGGQSQNYNADRNGVNANFNFSQQQPSQTNLNQGIPGYGSQQASNHSSGIQNSGYTQQDHQNHNSSSKSQYRPGPTSGEMLGPQGNIELSGNWNHPTSQSNAQTGTYSQVIGQESATSGHSNLQWSEKTAPIQAQPVYQAAPVSPQQGPAYGSQIQTSYAPATISGNSASGQQAQGLSSQQGLQGQTYGQYSQQSGSYSPAQTQYTPASPSNYGTHPSTYAQPARIHQAASPYTPSVTTTPTTTGAIGSNIGSYGTQNYASQSPATQTRVYSSGGQSTYATTHQATSGNADIQRGLHSAIAGYPTSGGVTYPQASYQTGLSGSGVQINSGLTAHSYTGGQSMGTQPTQPSTGTTTGSYGGAQVYNPAGTGSYSYSKPSTITSSGYNVPTTSYQPTSQTQSRYGNP